MRTLIAASLMLPLAALPALAQGGKLWEQGKVLTCTVTTAHSCKGQGCETQQISAQVRIDLNAMKACIVQGSACGDTETIGATKAIEKVFLVYVGQDKEDPTIFRIWEDGRFTAMGLREISGEGGYVMLGTCAAQ
jgi:hypothetical protein